MPSQPAPIAHPNKKMRRMRKPKQIGRRLTASDTFSASIGNHPIIYCYKPVHYSDDLDVLLSSKRCREARKTLMCWRVNNAMDKRMDTGIRVNRALAQVYGHAAPTDRCPRQFNSIPTDATTLWSSDMSDQLAENRGIMLVGVCRAEHERRARQQEGDGSLL